MKMKLYSLAVCVLLTTMFTGYMVQPSFGQQQTIQETSVAKSFPTKWDLTKIYANEKAWEEEYNQVKSLVPEFEQFRGKLNSAEGMYQLIQFAYNGEFNKLYNRLTLYAKLGTYLDPSNATFSNMVSKVNQLESELNVATAYVDAEIFSLPLEQRKKIFSDPLLKPYAYAMKEYTDPDAVHFDEETSSIIATLRGAMDTGETIYSLLHYVDMPFPEIELPDGTVKTLDANTYQEILYGEDYDRAFKRKAFDMLLHTYDPYLNTYAAILESTLAQNWALAQVNGYDSTREYCMELEDINPVIFDKMISAAHKGIPDMQRYYTAHKKALGLEEQYIFDTSTPLYDYEPPKVSYEEAVLEVREALSILGEDYIAKYDKIVSSPNIDVYPAKGKVGGAFSWMVGDEYLPYMLMNFNGFDSDVSTLAHQIGYSIYSMYSAEKQEPINQDTFVFTQEVAATTNEMLYYRYKLEEAETPEEEIYYLEQLINKFNVTFFIQALYSEFEDDMYQIVESGGSLNAEELNEKWKELYNTYRGDSVTFLDASKNQWCALDHLHYGYYMYSYATSIAYAATISDRIWQGDEKALQDYKNFLTLGCSMSPVELLQKAGIDPLSDKTYDTALTFYKELVDRYETLIAAK